MLLVSGQAQSLESEDADWGFLPPLPPAHWLAVSYSFDEASSHSQQFRLNLESLAQSRLELGLVDSTTVGSGSKLETRDRLLSWSSDPLQPWSLNLSVDDSGNDSVLLVVSRAVGIRWSGSQMSLSYQWQNRDVLVYPRLPLPRNDHFVVPGSAHFLSLNWYGSQHWSAALFYADFNYERDPGLLIRDPRLRPAFTLGTLQLGTALDSSRRGMSLGYSQASTLWSLDWLQSRGQLDDSLITDLSLAASHKVSQSWSVLGRLGLDRDDGGTQTAYAEIGLQYHW